MSSDRRARIYRSVVFSKTLTAPQMRFMVLVIHLGPQTVDGERRHVSKALGWNGHFALHLDYIGKALGISPDGVKYLRRECEKKGYLSEVHRGVLRSSKHPPGPRRKG